jgi:hypothetical protein
MKKALLCAAILISITFLLTPAIDGKRRKPKIEEYESPKFKVKLVLTRFSFKDSYFNYYRQVEIRDLKGKRLFLVDDGHENPDYAFAVINKDHLWSPDGRFIHLFQHGGFVGKSRRQVAFYPIIDICTGQEASFLTKEYRSAGSYGITQWKEGEPHTAMMGHEEGYPDPEPDPSACKGLEK